MEITGVKMGKNNNVVVLDNEIANKLSQLDTISLKDGLTGLWNKKCLADKVDDYVGGEVNSGALFIIEIDDFAKINDEYGHIMGDACLVRLAGVLSSSFRERDVAARISADEFGVFLVGTLTYKDINSIASKLLKVSRESFEGMKLDKDFTISIGIAKAPANGSDFLSLYRKAVEALTKSKQGGKNGFMIAEENYSENKSINTDADMDIVKHLISEKDKPLGAYKVEYDGFKHIFRFISRYSDRKETGIEIIGDVATKYSSCQYLVMLVGANKIKPQDVVERVVKNYSFFADKYNIVVKYDIDCKSLQEE